MVFQSDPIFLGPSRPEVYSHIIGEYLPYLIDGTYNPVKVARLGGRHIICDGHNRTSGLYLLGKGVKLETIESDRDLREYKIDLMRQKMIRGIDRAVWESVLFGSETMEKMIYDLRESMVFLRVREISSIGDLFVVRPGESQAIRLSEIKKMIKRGEINLEEFFRQEVERSRNQ